MVDCVRPDEASEDGWIQLPAPPRPECMYSGGGAGVGCEDVVWEEDCDCDSTSLVHVLEQQWCWNGVL